MGNSAWQEQATLFVIVYRVDGVVEKFKLDKSRPFGYVSMDESGRIPPS